MERKTPSAYIDELKHLRIQDFRGLLDMGTWIREYLHDRGRYSEPYEKYLKTSFRLNGRDYDVTLHVKETPLLETVPEFFYFEWINEGQKLHFIVYIITRTIGKNTYYLFQCPYTRTACRNLYTTANGYLCGRRAIAKCHYKSQCEYTPKSLVFLKHIMTEPFKPYGKEFYRDKRTPYGKKCLKYYQKWQALKKAQREAELTQKFAKPQPPKPLIVRV